MKMSVLESLYCDIKHEMDICNFDNESDTDNGYQNILSRIDEADAKEISDDDKVKLKEILDNKEKSLAESYVEMLDFIDSKLLNRKSQKRELPNEVVIKICDLDEKLAEKLGEVISDYLVGKYHTVCDSFSFDDTIKIEDISWADEEDD